MQADWVVRDVPPRQHVEGTLPAPFEARWVRQPLGKGSASASSSAPVAAGAGGASSSTTAAYYDGTVQV